MDKRVGMTSHDVVARARRALRERRIGHHGTLDPFATGLLVLLVGRATRLAPWIGGEPKVYDAVIQFGVETTTDDLTGESRRTAPLPEATGVQAAIAALTGKIEQQPPEYSAKRVAGERAYAAARSGRPLELRPVSVTVHAWELHALTPDRAEVTITCGSGTYVRALARDLGRYAGSAAHVTALRRTASGPFSVREAVPVDALGEAEPTLRSPLDGMPDVARQQLSSQEQQRVSRGMTVEARVPGDRAALLDADARLLAVAERDATGTHWQPRVVLADA